MVVHDVTLLRGTLHVYPTKFLGEGTWHRSNPVRTLQGAPLRFRNSNGPQILILAVKRNEIRNIQAAMKCRYRLGIQVPHYRAMQVIDVKVDQVEIFSSSRNHSEHSHMIRHCVFDLLCPQRPFAPGIKPGSGD
jgi:hypothetical protein